MDWRSRCASANRPNPAARTSTPLAPSRSAMIRSPAFADSLDMDRQTLCQLPLLGGDQRRIHNMLGQKPDLELVGSNDATHQQVVRPVIAERGGVPGRSPRLLEND